MCALLSVPGRHYTERFLQSWFHYEPLPPTPGGTKLWMRRRGPAATGGEGEALPRCSARVDETGLKPWKAWRGDGKAGGGELAAERFLGTSFASKKCHTEVRSLRSISLLQARLSPYAVPVKLPPLSFVVLDTETTGFVPRVHHVIEFASMHVEDGKLKEEYEQLFIAKEVPPHVEVLTRIRTADIQDKPTFEDKRAEVQAHLPEGILIVGQNVTFDLNMLKGEGIDLSAYAWIDTSMLASLVFPELQSYSLGYLSRVLDLDHNPPHRALGDVRATAALLGKCWERLLELPAERLAEVKAIMAKSTPGYRMLFAALPDATATAAPAWLSRRSTAATAEGTPTAALPVPSAGKISLQEEPLDPLYLQRLLRTSLDRKTWFGVKNLRTALARFAPDLQAHLEDGTLRALRSPHDLLDEATVEKLRMQDAFTADEATLLTKITWFAPRYRSDLAVHGGEEAVWNGKLSCTDASPHYARQFADQPGPVILEHRELLRFLQAPAHPAHVCLLPGTHVVLDDASMLEDTATKAFGWFCAFDELRAGAQGDARLTQLVDTAQLWLERTRQGQDIRYLTPNDLGSPECTGLSGLITEILEGSDLAEQTRQRLEALLRILAPASLHGRIAWIEQRQNGSQTLHSVPGRVGAELQTSLFSIYPTTLLIPPETAKRLPEILPPEKSMVEGVTPVGDQDSAAMPLSFSANPPIEELLASPPEGKTVILLPGKGMIEDLFVKHTEALEAKGVTLICQGMSGGQGRMQAEFLAAPAPAVWLLTPWTFEGIDLPPGTVQHLILKSLPFDHPSHPVLSKRSLHYANPFGDYNLPRLLHRLFRLLRTYCRFASAGADVRVLDERLFSKGYGKDVRAYLKHFALGDAAGEDEPRATPPPKYYKKPAPPAEPKPKAEKKPKGPEDQLTLF
jgi:DNA polymerase III epsilon subunit-like protein